DTVPCVTDPSPQVIVAASCDRSPEGWSFAKTPLKVDPNAAENAKTNGGPTTTDHLVPSQCSISIESESAAFVYVYPAAQSSDDEIVATPKRKADPVGLGLGMTLHFVPSQCSMIDGQAPLLPPPEAPTV